MSKIIRLIFTIICLILLVDSSSQSRARQTMMAAKAIGKTIKNPQFKNISNAIKKPMVKAIGNPIKNSVDMFRQTKGTIKTLANGLEQGVLKTKHNFGTRSVKFFEGGAVKKFKHGAPQAFKEVTPLINAKGKKSLYTRSVAYMGAKQFRSLGKRSAEYIRGKELGSFINMISKSKSFVPLLFAAGGLERGLRPYDPDKKTFVNNAFKHKIPNNDKEKREWYKKQVTGNFVEDMSDVVSPKVEGIASVISQGIKDLGKIFMGLFK